MGYSSPGYRHSQIQLFRGSVVIHLETNRLLPRIHYTQNARPFVRRDKVLRRAFAFARTDTNTNNAEGAFPWTTLSATSLPMPTTAATTTDVAAFAGRATTAATAGLPTAAVSATKVVSYIADDATLIVDQKQNARTACHGRTTRIIQVLLLPSPPPGL
jgi:hypothetical protein